MYQVYDPEVALLTQRSHDSDADGEEVTDVS